MKLSALTCSVQAEGDLAASNTTLTGPNKPDSSLAGVSATLGVDALASLSTQMAAESKEACTSSEGLVQKPILVSGYASPDVSDDDNVKSKTIDLNEAVFLPVITPETI